MGQYAAERRPVACRQGCQQRGVKPAPVLITALQIKIGASAKAWVLLDHRRMADSGIEPDIENILFAGEIMTVAIGTAEIWRNQLVERADVPSIGSFLGKNFRDMIAELAGEHRVIAIFAIDRGYRHAPRTLPRDAPVGPGFEHAANSVAPPRRYPMDLIDRLERLVAQIV